MTRPSPTLALRTRDPWPLVLFVLHLAHTLWFYSRYPDGVFDPDLLAYFVYFRNWLDGVTALHAVDYFTVPKPLLVFLLGPLDSAGLAFAVTALVSSSLGPLVYAVGCRTLGKSTGIVLALLLLLDIERATLTLRSSADLYVAVLLAAAILASLRDRYVLSGLAIALAGLAKPVALACALHLLAVPRAGLRRGLLGFAVSCAAVPLMLAANHVLLGSALAPERFFSGYDAASTGEAIASSELLRFVVWVQFVKTVFPAVAPFGFLGLLVWLARDRTRLTSPLLLVPMLFLGGYVALSIQVPFVPFFRFFWPAQIWFAAFLVFGMLETARRLAPGHRLARIGAAAVLVFFVGDNLLMRQLGLRLHFAGPFEDAQAFVNDSSPTLLHDRAAGETVLTPIAFLPYLLWRLDDARTRPTLVMTAELLAASPPDRRPDWIVYVPRAFLTSESRAYVERLLSEGGYDARYTGAGATLFTRTGRTGPLVLGPPST